MFMYVHVMFLLRASWKIALY